VRDADPSWQLTLTSARAGQADKILVNSEYTANVFERTFTRLDRGPRVVYPGIDIRRFGSGAPAGLRLCVRAQ
jgi:alpha-1,3/alpha-1,6-mannosyltransferase